MPDSNFESLRRSVDASLRTFAGDTHRELDGLFARLGLAEVAGTKAERIDGAIASMPDSELSRVAGRLLGESQLTGPRRAALQDAVWLAEGSPDIPMRTRRELARALDLEDLAYDPERFRAALGRWWPLGDDDPMQALAGLLGHSSPTGLAALVERHVLRNSDWTTVQLFDEVGAFDAVGTRFARFLEDLVSADTVPDEETQRRIVRAADPHLRAVGFELRETGLQEGYPVFSFVPTGQPRNRAPKQLIFATPTKPDLRLSSSVDNDIEIVTGADQVLVYDREIPDTGLLWRDLQAWWMETQGSSSGEKAKEELYARLRQSRPGNSPGQFTVFDVYYHVVVAEAAPDLPVLLPEVWLHWDPKTVRQRGAAALLGHRMDFLLLLPGRQRVVIEVDGSHHFESADAYAATARGSRELIFAGYEVYRFGTAELQPPTEARDLLVRFFGELFRKYRVVQALR